MNLCSLPDWLSYIERLHHSAIDMGLSRVIQIAKDLSLTNFDCPVVTVAGTNGKGSCVACLESVYTEAGYQVATYTSPHINQFNERIRLHSNLVSDDQLLSAFEVIESRRQALNISLSFFEFTTLSALWIFKQASPDVVLLEVGLGGRLDATNIVENDVAVITSIALDHMDWLGDTRELILSEKIGIARKNAWLIFGDEDPPSNYLSLIESCQVNAAIIGQDYRYQSIGRKLIWQTQFSEITLSPPVSLKHQNIATAVMTMHTLSTKLPITTAQVLKGIAKVALSGRFEQLSTKPLVIVDVAHNAAASTWLAKQVRDNLPDYKILAVFGIMKDKDIEAVLTPLLPLVDTWFVTDLPVARGESAVVVSQKLTAYDVEIGGQFDTISAALSGVIHASDQMNDKTMILVFGSFHMVAGAKQYFMERGV